MLSRFPVGFATAIAVGSGVAALLPGCSGASTPTIAGDTVDASIANGSGSSTSGSSGVNPIFIGADGGSTTSSGGGTTGGTSGDSGSSGGSGSTGSGGSGDDGGSSGASAGMTYGDVVQGVYNYGPVQWTGSFHNACSPYTDSDETAIGSLLAGLSEKYNGDASLCDACVKITTRLGKSVIAHVITSGVTMHDGDIDLSPDAYNMIYQDDPQGTPDYPRPMSWQLVSCSVQGNIDYDFQTQSSEYWTSFWVRNIRLAVLTVEVKGSNHTDWFALRRETDGTYNCDDGVGAGAFDVRVTAENGAVLLDHFDSVPAGMETSGSGQF